MQFIPLRSYNDKPRLLVRAQTIHETDNICTHATAFIMPQLSESFAVFRHFQIIVIDTLFLLLAQFNRQQIPNHQLA